MANILEGGPPNSRTIPKVWLTSHKLGRTYPVDFGYFNFSWPVGSAA
jgi:hypothetical protein